MEGFRLISRWIIKNQTGLNPGLLLLFRPQQLLIHIRVRRRRRWCFEVSPAEGGDNSSPCLRFVSCQQAPSGAPKCTICDHQVRGAITLCPAASDDENVLGHFCFGWQGKTGTRCHDDSSVFPHRTDRAEIRAVRLAVAFLARLACSFRAKRGQPSRSLD